MIDDSQLIAEILAAGLANQQVVQQGIALAEQTEASLYHTLILHNLVEERGVVEIASDLLNVPYVDLSSAAIDEEVLGLLPAELARQCQSLPLEFIDDGGSRTLRLAMIDPIDVMAMDDVANYTGVNIRPVLVGPADFKSALSRLYREQNSPPPLPKGSGAGFGGGDPEDSWAALFDEPGAGASLGEESSVLSQEMRDRPPTDIFEVVDDDIVETSFSGQSSLSGLVAPVEGAQALKKIDLDEWELDDAFESSSPEAMLGQEQGRERRGDQTLIGVGIRGGLAGLGLQEISFDEYLREESDGEEDEEFDLGLMGFELPSIAGGEDEELEPFEEISAPSLEHSIEMALDLGDWGDGGEEGPASPLVEQATIAVPFDARELAGGDFLFSGEQERSEMKGESGDVDGLFLGELSEGSGHILEEISEPRETKKRLPRAPTSIRAALERAAERKKESLSDSDRLDESTLGRIKVKRIAVPRFQGAVEKRSDHEREVGVQEVVGEEEAPATRELSVADLMGLQASVRDTAEAIPVSAVGGDAMVVLQGLLRLLVAKELVSPAEVQRLLEEATKQPG